MSDAGGAPAGESPAHHVLAPRPLDIDAVLFDLDGTLVDTAPDLAGALNRVRVDRGLAPMPVDALRPFASAGARGLIGAGFELTPDHERYPELRDAFLAHYEAALCVDSAVFHEVADVLDAIVARGLSWGIVTNKATRYTQPLLVALGLPRAPDVVVCGDTTPHAKPHPAPLLAAAAQLQVAPERCLYVGRRGTRRRSRTRRRDADARRALRLHPAARRAGGVAGTRASGAPGGSARLAAAALTSRRAVERCGAGAAAALPYNRAFIASSRIE